jgi:hypothetical protein
MSPTQKAATRRRTPYAGIGRRYIGLEGMKFGFHNYLVGDEVTGLKSFLFSVIKSHINEQRHFINTGLQPGDGWQGLAKPFQRFYRRWQAVETAR